MGPRPVGNWKGLNGRRKSSVPEERRGRWTYTQVAAMEWEALNASAQSIGGFRNFSVSGRVWKGLTTKDIGRLGEDAAMEYLLHKGFRLRTRNWYCGHKELDLVMDDERGIHIVEVRTRKAPAVIAPEQTVDWMKRQKLIAAADAYVKAYGERREVFFDIVSVVLGCDVNGRVAILSLEHIENAFLPIGANLL